jgi:PncC family amidohydrolase
VKPELEIAQLLARYEVQTGSSLSIGTAESATGGRVADRLTDVPGSSGYFRGSVVAYSDEVKINVLGVNRATLEAYGAVSEQTAREMAEGGRRVLGVDICIADTGIAGPSGGSPGKPVGLFYLGLAARDGSLSQEHMFQGNRRENKRDVAEEMLNTLKWYLLQFISLE